MVTILVACVVPFVAVASVVPVVVAIVAAIAVAAVDNGHRGFSRGRNHVVGIIWLQRGGAGQIVAAATVIRAHRKVIPWWQAMFASGAARPAPVRWWEVRAGKPPRLWWHQNGYAGLICDKREVL